MNVINGQRVAAFDHLAFFRANIPQTAAYEIIMSPLRRHIFVCFMAKSAFFFGGGGFRP